MVCACLQTPEIIQQVARLLEAVCSVDLDRLELLVQQAHECDIKQVEDPAEPFAISRQALRMFWHFRRQLESVEVIAQNG